MQLDLNLLHLAYLIGGIGILVEWRAYCLPDGVAFRRWSAAGAVLWAAQYLLLDAWTAGLTMASTALRTLLSSRLQKGVHKHWTAASFVALFSGLTACSWQGPVSLLPAFAVINTTLALFYLNNRRMRIALLASSLAWISNDCIWEAWPALVAETVAMGLNLRTISKLLAR
ncbi:YgjV family protein [Methylomonas sp. OY6]|uniref:YgjV family protein n=1 Tax=Methylomonas defluvii TaxID=3045149 RepID=A0ABU4UIJ5_9GAMM|nr:YgjV family protein [Methylomonas sp. OY6]MDX8129307.1 YgjV family protein [Methylomonas sp. OY6]